MRAIFFCIGARKGLDFDLVGGNLILLYLFCLAHGRPWRANATDFFNTTAWQKNVTNKKKTLHRRPRKYGLVALNYTKALKDLVHKLCILRNQGVQYLSITAKSYPSRGFDLIRVFIHFRCERNPYFWSLEKFLQLRIYDFHMLIISWTKISIYGFFVSCEQYITSSVWYIQSLGE